MNGVFSANSPFTAQINTQLNYTCISIETINGLLARGNDPYTNVYFSNFPSNESKAKYEADRSQNIPIYTLQSSKGDLVSLPGSYLVGMPDMNGIGYVSMMLCVSLSAIPSTLSLSSIKREVSDLIFDRLGVRSVAKTVALGLPSVLSTAEHTAIEAARVANVTKNISTLTQINQLQIQNTALLNRVTVLENYIMSLPN